jgi:hypothetical protein
VNRLALPAALIVGIAGAILAPRFGPTAAFSPLVAFSVCVLGALVGLLVVSYALELDAQR